MVRMWWEDFPIKQGFSKGQDGGEKLVCETDGELLCVEDGDLSVLLGGASEVLYDNTVSVGQLRGITDQNLAGRSCEILWRAMRTARMQG